MTCLPSARTRCLGQLCGLMTARLGHYLAASCLTAVPARRFNVLTSDLRPNMAPYFNARYKVVLVMLPSADDFTSSTDLDDATHHTDQHGTGGDRAASSRSACRNGWSMSLSSFGICKESKGTYSFCGAMRCHRLPSSAPSTLGSASGGRRRKSWYSKREDRELHLSTSSAARRLSSII